MLWHATVIGVTADTPDRARTVLTAISPRAYEHPADRAALSALRKVRGFDQMLRWLSGVFGGRGPGLLALGSTVRVAAGRFPAFHRLFLAGASVLDLPGVLATFVMCAPHP